MVLTSRIGIILFCSLGVIFCYFRIPGKLLYDREKARRWFIVPRRAPLCSSEVEMLAFFPPHRGLECSTAWQEAKRWVSMNEFKKKKREKKIFWHENASNSNNIWGEKGARIVKRATMSMGSHTIRDAILLLDINFCLIICKVFKVSVFWL